MRILPFDLDAFFHVNNGRYLTLFDACRLDLMIQIGAASVCYRRKFVIYIYVVIGACLNFSWVLIMNRWLPLAGAAQIRFLKQVRCFEPLLISTRTVFWDHKWIVLEHKITDGKGDLCVESFVRVIFKEGSRTVTPIELLAAVRKFAVYSQIVH